MMESTDTLFRRSQEFEDGLLELLRGIKEFSSAPKAKAGGGAAQLAIEHRRATRELFGSSRSFPSELLTESHRRPMRVSMICAH